MTHFSANVLFRNSLASRSDAKEMIDEHVADFPVLAESFADIARANRYFGGIAPVRDLVLGLQPRRVLDVGCGFADLARAIVRGARSRAQSLDLTCLDTSPAILALAQDQSRIYPEIRFVLGRGERLPFPDASFDVAICTLTLHHCEPTLAVGLLGELGRVARHPIIADLRRCVGGYLGAYAFSRLLSRNILTRNDAPLSVQRAYTPAEARALSRQAGWRRPLVKRTPFFRMLLHDEG